MISLFQSAADKHKTVHSSKVTTKCILSVHVCSAHCDSIMWIHASVCNGWFLLPPAQSISISTRDILCRLFQSCIMHSFPSLLFSFIYKMCSASCIIANPEVFYKFLSLPSWLYAIEVNVRLTPLPNQSQAWSLAIVQHFSSGEHTGAKTYRTQYNVKDKSSI